MSNWPQPSLYRRYQGPLEVEGGLLFEADQWAEAGACADRCNASGLRARVLSQPGDIGVFVSITGQENGR